MSTGRLGGTIATRGLRLMFPLQVEIDERQAQMFPKLDHRQIERLVRCGQRRHVEAGEVLFEQGEINTRFYALISGRLEVVRPTERGTEELVRLHEPGDFTGEVNI